MLGYFINLLKTISLKLNAGTIQFFFRQVTTCSQHFLNSVCGPPPLCPSYGGGACLHIPEHILQAHHVSSRPMVTCHGTCMVMQASGDSSQFPLYTEAIKLVRHRDGMVRAAVRTLTLNVFSIHERPVLDFVIAPPADAFFSDLAALLTDQCQVFLPTYTYARACLVYKFHRLYHMLYCVL